jgi:hypothetical protein
MSHSRDVRVAQEDYALAQLGRVGPRLPRHGLRGAARHAVDVTIRHLPGRDAGACVLLKPAAGIRARGSADAQRAGSATMLAVDNNTQRRDLAEAARVFPLASRVWLGVWLGGLPRARRVPSRTWKQEKKERKKDLLL